MLVIAKLTNFLVTGSNGMLNLRKRRPAYGQYSRNYGYNKPKRSLPWWKIGLSLPIAVILMELCAQGFLALADKEGKVTGRSPQENAYQLQYLTQTEKAVDGLGEDGTLAVQRSPRVGYRLVKNQNSDFYGINDQGFREKDSIPLQKNKNDIRIFVLGGSTAFGTGSSNNEATVAQKLENLLQERVKDQTNNSAKYRPDIFPFFQPSREKLFKLTPKIKQGNYQVINAAVPGYTSGNELAQLALEILPYQPDMIVLINGYGDLALPSSYEQADIPKIDQFLSNASGHFTTTLSQGLHQGVQKSAIIKTAQSWMTQAQAAEFSQGIGQKIELPKDEAELKERVQRYYRNQQRILQISAKAGIPVVMVLQPEITRLEAEQLTPPEKAIQGQLNRKYREMMPKAYEQLIQANQKLVKAYGGNTKFINLYSPNFKGDKPLFLDNVHLTEAGNQKVANFVYYSLADWQKMQKIPENFHLK
ncbi:MAG: SGNH/GDSL hydrolase family protein [Microcystaceae cyanobacterium]